MNARSARDPKMLSQTRVATHHVCQWPSRAARANLEPKGDDSHSNLGWDDNHQGLVSRGLDSEQRFQVGYCFSDNTLIWLVDAVAESRLSLAQASEQSVGAWLDSRLVAAGLNPSSDAQMPYELEGVPEYKLLAENEEERLALAAWFAYGQRALSGVLTQYAGWSVTPTTVRCWPHHYDLGALLMLEAGDAETARSIGIGFSPGDGSYAEPYFYCNPWPVPDKGALVAPAAPLFWHTEGFVSMVCKSSDMTESTDIDAVLAEAMHSVRGSLRAN